MSNYRILKVNVVKVSSDRRAVSITLCSNYGYDTDPVALMNALPDMLAEDGFVCLPEAISGSDIIEAANSFKTKEDIPASNTYACRDYAKNVYAAALEIFSESNSGKFVYAGVDNVCYNSSLGKWMLTILAVNPAYMVKWRAC